jgi:hypothetical protein
MISEEILYKTVLFELNNLESLENKRKFFLKILLRKIQRKTKMTREIISLIESQFRYAKSLTQGHVWCRSITNIMLKNSALLETFSS